MPPLDFTLVLQDGDALIIVPPFAQLERPCLAAHLLQACAREAGIRVSVLYANHLWAAIVGEDRYREISCGGMRREQIGERIFAAAAYGGPILGRDETSFRRRLEALDLGDAWRELARLATVAGAWADTVAAAVTQSTFRAVGCTTTFQQTSACVALLDRIKARRPMCLTMIGGANCEGEMAEGIASLSPSIDVIFSGESERTFVHFMQDLQAGHPPMLRIIAGAPCLELDGLPTPTYKEFFEQRTQFLPHSRIADRDTWLPVESSRGCWWGEKQQCTFCGLNASGMRFRAKSPDRLIDELVTLRAAHPARRIMMTDRVMPYMYFRTVIPRLKTEVPGLEFFYEQKANLVLEQVMALKQAGVTMIQPGIEALSSSLLRRMRKGVSAAQNIALLRYARSAAMYVGWSLLIGFPGEQLEDYKETLALLPLVQHLYPPQCLADITLNRFSPYVDDPASYGIGNIRPEAVYKTVFPDHADASKLAYYFEADYESAARDSPELRDELARQVTLWREAWGEDWQGGANDPPLLIVQRLSGQALLLRDTRGLAGTATLNLLSRQEASVALVGRRYEPTPVLEWALAHRIGVVLDGLYVPWQQRTLRCSWNSRKSCEASRLRTATTSARVRRGLPDIPLTRTHAQHRPRPRRSLYRPALAGALARRLCC